MNIIHNLKIVLLFKYIYKSYFYIFLFQQQISRGPPYKWGEIRKLIYRGQGINGKINRVIKKKIYNNFNKAINKFFHKNIYNLLAIIVHPFLLLLHNYILVPLLVESNFLRRNHFQPILLGNLADKPSIS